MFDFLHQPIGVNMGHLIVLSSTLLHRPLLLASLCQHWRRPLASNRRLIIAPSHCSKESDASCTSMTETGPNPALRNRDLLALRAFVTARDGSTAVSSQHVMALDLTHSNLKQRHLEIRFPLDATLSDLRMRLYRSTGTPPRDQHLLFYDHDDGDVPDNASGGAANGAVREVPPDAHVNTDDQIPLRSFFGPWSEYGYNFRRRVHCVDVNPHSTSARGALEDVRLVTKFRLSDEDYDRRSGTLRDWCRRQQVLDPSFTLEKHAVEHRALREATALHRRGQPLPPGFEVDTATGKVVKLNPVAVKDDDDNDEDDAPPASIGDEEDDAVHGAASVLHATVGTRCQVSPGGRRGVVRWIGKLPGKIGWFVGVALDEPVGLNDGSLDGIRHFEVESGHGLFVRGCNLRVGDFPERDLFADNDDDDDDDDDDIDEDESEGEM